MPRKDGAREQGVARQLNDAISRLDARLSQISNPVYPVPIPAPHLEIIFEICHFSGAEKREFLECFTRAHPGRRGVTRNGPTLRSLRLEVVDFGDAKRNREFDNLVRELARRLGKMAPQPG